MSKLLKKVLSRYFHNSGHYEFFTEVDTLVEKYPTVVEITGSAYTAFKAALTVEDAAFHLSRRSDLTERLADAARRIECGLRGLHHVVKGLAYYFDPAIAADAKSIQARLKEYGRIGKKSYEDESGDVKKLIEDLNGPYKVKMTTLNLTAWTGELAQAEAQFGQLMAHRTEEAAARPDVNMRTARRATEEAYDRMRNIVDSDIVLNGPATCGAFVTYLNGRIEYFNHHANPRRAARNIRHHVETSDVADRAFTGKYLSPVFEWIRFVEAGREPANLFAGKDYLLTYKDNVKPGIGRIVIHGKGKYRGTTTVTFNILPPANEN
jgi:hypothetical protein